MYRRYLALLAVALLACTALHAADRNQDALDDGDQSSSDGLALDVGDIAVVDTGDGTVSIYVSRLLGLGYPVTTIPAASGLDVLVNYSVVILPVSHADAGNYATFDALAADYHAYVQTGGGLWVGQPNPYQMPGNEAVITWVPYYLFIHNGYNSADCPPVIIDAGHCITTGLPADGFSFPGDTVLDMGAEWHVLLEGPVTGRPAVMVAEHGAGRILVELGHPSPSAICGPSDAALERYVDCIMGGPVATELSTWSDVKDRFR